MIAQKIMEQINEQFSGIIKNNPLAGAEENLKTVLMSVFSKLDLVTREEFDVQQKVLIATREKLEELEQKLVQLHKK